MRRFLFFAAIALVLSSCAVYTAEYGYGRIRVPEVTGLPETRYAAIVEENKNKSAEAIENARKEAEHRAAMKRKADVNEYPENLAELTFPHIYTPLNTNSTEVDGINTIKVLLLPLGYDSMSQDDARRILEANADISPDFVILTGSLENQVTGAKTSGWDAVTLTSGTILHRPLLKTANENTAIFFITSTKDVEIAPLSFQNNLPATADEAEAWALAASGDDTEKTEVQKIAETMTDKEKILSLSSSSPSGEDWIDFTPFRYRTSMEFPVSSYLEENGWLDAYRATHFSAETDGGITRKNGAVYERLDFLYTEALIPVSAISYPVMGLTDRTGTFAVLAEFLIP